jgi:hypothetical protein
VLTIGQKESSWGCSGEIVPSSIDSSPKISDWPQKTVRKTVNRFTAYRSGKRCLSSEYRWLREVQPSKNWVWQQQTKAALVDFTTVRTNHQSRSSSTIKWGRGEERWGKVGKGAYDFT